VCKQFAYLLAQTFAPNLNGEKWWKIKFKFITEVNAA
jgi:hypothetical protein